jgi:hypothetical protein
MCELHLTWTDIGSSGDLEEDSQASQEMDAIVQEKLAADDWELVREARRHWRCPGSTSAKEEDDCDEDDRAWDSGGVCRNQSEDVRMRKEKQNMRYDSLWKEQAHIKIKREHKDIVFLVSSLSSSDGLSNRRVCDEWLCFSCKSLAS